MSNRVNSGLVLSHVRKAFQKVVAVEDFSPHVPNGSMFGLVGANGAGKTTTLRMILNILNPDEGTITWNGAPASTVPRRFFGYLPEERGLYPKMKVGDELVFLAGLNDIPQSEAKSRAREWLGRVGLADGWGRKVEELSKGNQQKVQVLAAILHDPQIMLLDEPFSGLDPINTEVLRDTLLERRSVGRTIIFSSHRLEQVEELCDHVAIIHRGRLLAAGAINDLKRSTGKSLVQIGFELNGSGHEAPMRSFLEALAPYHASIREQRNSSLRIELNNSLLPDEVLQLALRNGPGPLRHFEIVEPTLQEIFLGAVAAADPTMVRDLVEEGSLPGGKVLTEG